MDCDILGLRLRDKEHADVALAVNWQRIDDSEMRSTELVQHWTDHRHLAPRNRRPSARRRRPPGRAHDGHPADRDRRSVRDDHDSIALLPQILSDRSMSEPLEILRQ